MSAPSTLEQANNAAESVTFATLFSSAVDLGWFERMMENAGSYIFTFALFLNAVKFGIAIYKFAKAKNKNLQAHDALLWNTLQFGLIATAIIGTLVAAGAFAVVTPLLFTIAMGLDCIRNAALFLWNLASLAYLKITLRKELAGERADPLTQIKYVELKKQHSSSIKRYAIGMTIAAFVTAAVLIIFLFPHVGLAAVGATVISIGAVKISVAAMVGIAAAIAILSPIVLPLLRFGLQKLASFCKSLINKVQGLEPKVVFSKKYWSEKKKVLAQMIKKGTARSPEYDVFDLPSEDETSSTGKARKESAVAPATWAAVDIDNNAFDILKKLPHKRTISTHHEVPITIEQDPSPVYDYTTFMISNAEDLQRAVDHRLAAYTPTKNNKFRELIIDRCANADLALSYLLAEISKKIQRLQDQIDARKQQPLAWLRNMELVKRQQKMAALQDILRYFGNKAKFVFHGHEVPPLVNEEHLDINNAHALVNYIERRYPEVHKSFFSTSDTDDLLAAIRVYAEKFEPHQTYSNRVAEIVELYSDTPEDEKDENSVAPGAACRIQSM